MPHHSSFNHTFREDPRNPGSLLLPPLHVPHQLQGLGFNLPVEITMSSADVSQLGNARPKTLTTFAHFDTGAARTAIDEQIASHLELTATGKGQIVTASGIDYASNYVVDLILLNVPLRPIRNLPVSSCRLGNFKLESSDGANNQSQKNFGVLLGRDIMASWSIFWHGPTSTVMISD